MQTYRLLFSVEVTHQYFVDHAWNGLTYQPAIPTRRMIAGSGAVLKTAGNRLNVYCQADRRAAMGLLAEETGGELRFVLNVKANDRGFRNFTALARIGPDHLLRFANDVAAGSDRVLRLSRTETASASDALPVSQLLEDGSLAPGDLRSSPDFLMDIRLSQEMIDAAEPPRFALGFANRQLFWNYFLFGGLNRENLFIVDLDDKVEFEALGGGFSLAARPAQVFRSKTALPVHEKSSLRLQLRERSNGSGKVIVKRLPVAADNFGLQTIDGEEKLVSNMFVNF